MAQQAAGLTVQGLAARRGELTLFADLDFSLGAGQWGCVTGPNGSGKTTLLRVVAGLTRPAAGSVSRPAVDDGGDGAMAYLAHQDGLHGHLTPREQLTLACGPGQSAQDHAVLLAAFGLARVAELQCRFLSHGQRRRLSLALLRITGAVLWLLDEPGSGLDDSGKTLLRELCEWQLDRGGLLLIATHEPLPLNPGPSVEIAFGH